jgi:hypothetical protein
MWENLGSVLTFAPLRLPICNRASNLLWLRSGTVLTATPSNNGARGTCHPYPRLYPKLYPRLYPIQKSFIQS